MRRPEMPVVDPLEATNTINLQMTRAPPIIYNPKLNPTNNINIATTITITITISSVPPGIDVISTL
jgi:hypothetical protein